MKLAGEDSRWTIRGEEDSARYLRGLLAGNQMGVDDRGEWDQRGSEGESAAMNEGICFASLLSEALCSSTASPYASCARDLVLKRPGVASHSSLRSLSYVEISSRSVRRSPASPALSCRWIPRFLRVTLSHACLFSLLRSVLIDVESTSQGAKRSSARSSLEATCALLLPKGSRTCSSILLRGT